MSTIAQYVATHGIVPNVEIVPYDTGKMVGPSLFEEWDRLLNLFEVFSPTVTPAPLPPPPASPGRLIQQAVRYWTHFRWQDKQKKKCHLPNLHSAALGLFNSRLRNMAGEALPPAT